MAANFFSFGGYLAMMGWLGLLASLFYGPVRAWTWRITGMVIPGLLAVAYVYLLLTNADPNPEGGFGSLQ
ncbi:MAG: hypothetical protein R3212_14275, partial [Xanthomonadales bacterium]|nr:hypothetical protein [Xanthomonadales bacterium]